jgi:Zn-finger nucleic acid-binding protein
MNCPTDGAELRMAERQGVEIDYCPQCRGVWLDRGELDKIIERADDYYGQPSRSESPRRDEARRDEGYRRDDRGSSHKRKPKNLLSELFDM